MVTLTFTEPTTYHRADYETASTWSRYEIQPGTYDVEFVNINYRPVPEGARPYYATVKLDARRVQHSYVNRLLTASSAHDEHTPEAPIEPLHRSLYAYAFEDTSGTRGDGTEYQSPRITEWLGGTVNYDQ